MCRNWLGGPVQPAVSRQDSKNTEVVRKSEVFGRIPSPRLERHGIHRMPDGFLRLYSECMIMTAASASDLKLLRLLSDLAFCNPLLPDRIAIEREILGSKFVAEDGIAWSRTLGRAANDRANVTQITGLAADLVDRLLESRSGKGKLSDDDLIRYWDVVIYVLMYRHVIPHVPDDLLQSRTLAPTWKDFLADYQHYSKVAGFERIDFQPAGHLFACLCQIHRAFVNIFNFILGNSIASVRLRGAVWQSIFTSNLQRYRRSLYNRMSAIPVLITGPTGTGKELVARAVGMSQYIPFDSKRACFVEESQSSFFPLNLSAMSATLIESELFGHCKGAFTGAVLQRTGWLEECRPHGAIFLDEIGELDPSLQVKLLRVVQNRTYSRLGETKERSFSGKIIGATNRVMDQEIQAGRFREDLYYRLCADRIQTPGLREQLDDCPEDLHALCIYIARRLAGEDGGSLAEQSIAWIQKNLGEDYPWSGNIRELEQCVGSVMIRNEYVPSDATREVVPHGWPAWMHGIHRAELTVDELLQHYCSWVYDRTGSYEASARQLGIDRRTVKSRIEQLKESEEASC